MSGGPAQADDPPVEPTPALPKEETAPEVQAAMEEHDIKFNPHWKRRRVLITTTVYVLLWAGSVAFIHAGQGIFAALFLLVPLYILTLPLVLKTPKKYKRFKKSKSLGERIAWQARLMISVVVFLALYLPFTFISNEVIPYAPIVEYLLFTFAVLLLMRLAGRSIGVAPSLDALPPPSHRIHQQVVAPIDDTHYQKTLWLNYAFVEKGKGQRHLARRLESLLDANGVRPERKAEILEPLESYREGFAWGLTRAARERRHASRETRGHVLESVFARINRELENSA